MLMKIQRVVARRIRRRYARRSTYRKLIRPICIVLLSLLLQSCAKPSAHEPVTLTLLDEWPNKTFSEARQQELQQFTRETGIRVSLLPSPESARQKLALWRELLGTGASGPDVYAVDVIWPGMLADYFVDLKPYFASEVAVEFPAVTAAYTVDNKLVAMPYHPDIGLLYYRTDLLRQYGYREPPRTWDELETMAARIQAGERAKGKKQFWGFVWQGAADEGLTCDALEWQAAEGGGRIIEENHTISVNNPQAIRAWRRAAHWVGSISPPGVVGYREWDSLNVWVAGDAAFMRNWPSAYVDSKAPASPILNKFDATLLPGGKAGRVGTLGGWGFAVSRFSAHPREALELVRYLTRSDMQVKRSRLLSLPPTLPELYNLPEVLEPNPRFDLLNQAFRTGIVLRPSNVSGSKYQDVSDAYIQAVHSVLTGQKGAPEAAAALEKELVRITGFKKGPPLAGSSNTTAEGRPELVLYPRPDPLLQVRSANGERHGMSSRPAIAP
jgi:trehalose/maltose transport system substrate-binding protein